MKKRAFKSAILTVAFILMVHLSFAKTWEQMSFWEKIKFIYDTTWGTKVPVPPPKP